MEFDAKQYVKNVESAVHYIRQQIRISAHGLPRLIDFKPKVALTLGSGLGKLAEQVENPLVVHYQNIPYFPKLSAEGHKGELIIGHIEDVPVVGLVGRKHFYEVAQEPYGMMQVVFPVHVMASLGVSTYLTTNAVGGLNMGFNVGDMMVMNDHLEYGSMPNPLTGPALDFAGNLYFQPQHLEYDPKLRRLFKIAAARVRSRAHVKDGIYTALPGRTYETAATCRVLRQLGVDAVGMSTTPEVIIATNRGMRTLAISLITNKVAADGTNATSHPEVMAILGSDEVKDRISQTFLTFFQLGHQQGMF